MEDQKIKTKAAFSAVGLMSLGWRLWVDVFGLMSLGWRLWVDVFGLTSLGWRLWVDVFGLTSLGWRLWVDVFGLTSLGWCLWIDVFGLMSLDWRLWIDVFGLLQLVDEHFWWILVSNINFTYIYRYFWDPRTSQKSLTQLFPSDSQKDLISSEGYHHLE